MLLALSLSLPHFSLSSTTLGRCSRQHPVPAQFLLVGPNWRIHVKESIRGRHLGVVVKQCPAYLVPLIWVVLRWEVSGLTGVLILGVRASKVYGQDQIVQSENYCYSSRSVASIEEIKKKKQPSKHYHDSNSNENSLSLSLYIYIYIYIYIYDLKKKTNKNSSRIWNFCLFSSLNFFTLRDN